MAARKRNETSISRRLTAMNMLVSGAALLLACLAFLGYTRISFKQSLVSDLTIQARMIGSGTVSAVLFDDAHSARHTLSALRASPHVLYAAVYRPDGRRFAEYRRDLGRPSLPFHPPPAGKVQAHWFERGQVTLVRSVSFQGKPAVVVSIQSDLGQLHSLMVRYAEIIILVLCGSLIAAFLVSRISQKSISAPIVKLAEIARAVSRDTNYSIRARPQGRNDEISFLVESFNGMLAQIQERDNALEEARSNLEERVNLRTAELEQARESLRTLSGQLIRTQDDERRRIARELHDSSGQVLAALGLNLALMEMESSRLSPQAARALSDSLTLVQDMTKELRTISHLLHPPLLDETGLAPALRWYVEGFSQRSNIAVQLDLTPELGRLPRDVETAVFRIIQECLTNIHRHSGSPTARVRIVRAAEAVTVEIHDDGAGMAPGADGNSSGPSRPGVGIQGMRERVRQLSGVLEIQSGKGGTTVQAVLPLLSADLGPAVV
ncbi:MAG TPA: CHASE sensor domain-containing protein [Terriglobia bacterium]|nr:CHASE sensor domain-containing protein [Terriglobia bacterium]